MPWEKLIIKTYSYITIRNKWFKIGELFAFHYNQHFLYALETTDIERRRKIIIKFLEIKTLKKRHYLKNSNNYFLIYFKNGTYVVNRLNFER